MRKHFEVVSEFESLGQTRVVIGNDEEFFIMTKWRDGQYVRPGPASQTVVTRSDFDWAAIGAAKWPSAEDAKAAWLKTVEAMGDD